MDTKRRMPDLVHPVMASSSSLLTSSHQAQALSTLPRPSPLPMLPWPVLQRRRIEKLKDDRLDEFGRACDENFEWLENYYQGCVYAAQQNRDYHEQEAAEVFGRSMSTDNGGSRTSQHFAADQHYDDDGMPFSPYTSGYYSGTGRSTASPSRHSLPQHRQQRQQQQRQKARHTPKNSPAKFRLKSPKSPNVARIGSPTSPYERQLHHHRQAAAAHYASHIHTTPRKKLRVTARPSSMRAQRALKAQRKRTASFQKDSGRQHQQKQQIPQQQKQHREHRDSKMDQQHEDHEQQRQEQQQHNQEQHHLSRADDTVKRRDSSPVTLKEPQQQQQQLKKEDSRRQSLDSTRKQSSNQDQDMGVHSRHTPTTPAEDRSFKSEADRSYKSEAERSFKSEADKSYNSEIDKSFYGGSFIAELRASTFKTPAKARSIRNERATNDREVDGEIDEYRLMPGSKARDSMTLKSPVNRSDISMDQDSNSPLRNRSPSSVTKRGSDLMETDQDRLVDAESKRSKSSPFLDSHVPIRFHSPEAESRTTTKSEGSTRQEWTKFNDLTSTSSAPRSAERSSAESASRWREPEAESLSAKNRRSDTNEQPPAASTTPTTTPHQRYGYVSSFTERPDTSSDESTRGASLRDVTQDQPNDAGITKSTHDKSSALHGQVNGDSAELRMNGDSERRQADYIDSHALPGNHQDHPPLRQAEQKKEEEDNTLPTSRPGRFGVGDNAEQNTRSKPATTTTTAATKSESTAFSSSFISSSDAGSLRSKAPMTLPGKRTLGTRRPVGTSSNALTSAFLPPSRLTKLTSTDLAGGAGSTTESKVLTAPQPDTSTFQASSSSRVARVGAQSTVKDTQQAGAGPNGTRPPTVPTTSSNSTTGLLSRQGAPARPPMTSGRVAAETSGVNGTTSNGVSRSDNQGSHLQRKPFAIPSSTVATTTTTSTSRSVFSLKKTTGRPVLPDGVSSALLASSSSSSTSTRPPSSSLAMMQARMDQHARESTPTQDFHSKSSHSTAQQRTEMKTTAAGSSTLSLSSVISSRKESMSTAGNGVRTEATQGSSRATSDGGHIFAVPAPVRQPLAQSWMSNSAQQERRHFKTILPEINSDGEDHDVNNNDESMRSSKRKKASVPDWTSWEELYRQMENQKNLNPEEIFGPIPMLDVAEIFPGREKKMSFRSRTSSAHWGASDALTPQEVTKYNEDMGWSGQE